MKRIAAAIEAGGNAQLRRLLIRAALFNFVVVSVIGLGMRAMAIWPLRGVSYKNILHAHSHFAFGGWVTPALFWMIMTYFPELRERVKNSHWRNIVFLTLLSAYGMLFSFAFQGYAIVSVAFSTLSILATFYFVALCWKRLADSYGALYLRAALVFLAVSAAGPFATGPLIAAGYAGTPIYYNAVYFYLHFQYNGWFTFAIIAIILSRVPARAFLKYHRSAFVLLISGVVMSYFMSVLWNQPSPGFYLIAGLGAVLQLTGLFCLLADIYRFRQVPFFTGSLFWLALAALCLKCLLQVAGAIPQMAALAYLQRNIIIAYLHLVMLGFVSLFVLHAVIYHGVNARTPQFAINLLIAAFVISEALLLANGLGGHAVNMGAAFSVGMFAISAAFPLATGILFHRLWHVRN